MSLCIIDYTEKSIVLCGNTEQYKDKIIEIRGTFNEFLKPRPGFLGGSGWIFPKSRLSIVERFIKDISINSIPSQLSLPTSTGSVSLQSQVETLKLEVKSLSARLLLCEKFMNKDEIVETIDDDEDNEEDLIIPMKKVSLLRCKRT